MKEENMNNPVNNFAKPYSGHIEHKSLQIQIALMQLESELYRTGELIQIIKYYIHEQHVVYVPVDTCSGRQAVMATS